MDSQEMVRRLGEYYSAKYSEERTLQLAKACSAIDEASRNDVYEHIIRNREKNTPISVNDIVEACSALGISTRGASQVYAQKWTCDCCGYEFRHLPYVSDDDRIDRDVHDRCPACGFQVAWTKTRDEYARRGIACQWYERYIDQFGEQGRFGRGKPGGMWFKRGDERQARAKEERARVAMVPRREPDDDRVYRALYQVTGERDAG